MVAPPLHSRPSHMHTKTSLMRRDCAEAANDGSRFACFTQFLMKCTGWGRAFFNKERDIWAVEYLKPSGFLISNGKLEGIDIDSVEPGS